MTAQELSSPVAYYLQTGSTRLFLTRVHILGPPFANHFVPLCHTHLPHCQCHNKLFLAEGNKFPLGQQVELGLTNPRAVSSKEDSTDSIDWYK